MEADAGPIQSFFESLTRQNAQSMDEIGMGALAFAMGVSLLCSFFASFLSLTCYASRPTGCQLHRAFPLLGPSITAIFLCIQFSLPLSLGLLGALSIVRFRTPIKEPEEIGFIMLVIATSIACATFKLAFLGVILGIAVVALLVRRYGVRALGDPQHDGVVVVSLDGDGAREREAAVVDVLGRQLSRGRLESVTRSDHGIELSYGFSGLRARRVAQLEQALEQEAGATRFHIFFHRPSAL